MDRWNSALILAFIVFLGFVGWKIKEAIKEWEDLKQTRRFYNKTLLIPDVS